MVYNTTTKCLDVAHSNAWESIYCNCPNLPSLNAITGNSPVCAGSNNTYTVAAIQGATSYTWSVTGNPTITGNGTNSISFNAPSLSTYTVSVTAVNACGSSTVNQTLLVNDFTNVPTTPTWNPTPASSLCTGTTVGYSINSNETGVNATSAINYTWNITATGSATALISGQTVSSSNPLVFSNTTNTAYTFVYGSGTGTVTISVVGNNTCGSGNALTQTITVVAQPSLISPTPSQSVCTNGAISALSTTPSGGTGTITYQWYSSSSNSNSGGTSLGSANGAQTTTYTPPSTATLSTVYYYMVMSASGLGCATATTPLSDASVTVVAQPALTVPTPATQTVCTNGIISAVSSTPSGGTGTIGYQWYSAATNVNTGGASIAGATAASYTPPATASTGATHYYLVMTASASGCNTATSPLADALVTVVAQPALTAPTPATQTVCTNGTIGVISTTVSGGTGTFTYQWFSSTSNITTGGSAIGTNSLTYTPPATSSTGTTYYYVQVSATGSGCNTTLTPSGSDASVTVVSQPTVPSPTPASQSLCTSGAPGVLSVSPSGGTGTFGYQWYSANTNVNSGGTIISGATSASYTPVTTNNGTKYYYCSVTQTGSGCSSQTTPLNDVSVTVVAPPSLIAPTPATQTVCTNGSIAQIASTLSGGTGNITYQWFSSATNVNSGGSAISGANSINYTPAPSASTGTTYYYLTVTADGTNCGSATSPTSDAAVTIVAQPAVTSPIAASQTVCTGASISLSATGSSGTGTATYTWYNNGSNNATTGGTVVGSNLATYPPPTIIAGTTYYYVTYGTSGSGCNVATSAATATVTVVTQPSVASPTPSSQSFCTNATPTSLSVSPAGGTGTFGYQWYSSTTNVNTGGTSLGSSNGAQTTSYTPLTSVVGTKYYYCVITETGTGCSTLTTPLNDASVAISAQPTITNPTPASQIICPSATPANLTATGASGLGTGTYTWYNNGTTNSTTGGTVDGTNSGTYSPPTSATAGTSYYYVTYSTSGTGCNTVTSTATASVTVSTSVPSAPTANAASNITATSFSANWGSLSFTPAVTSYILEVATSNSFGGTDILNTNVGNITTYSVTGLTCGTTYYYQVTPVNCNGNGTVSNTVSATPSATVSVGAISGYTVVGANQTGLTYSISAVPNATNYAWTVTGGGAAISGSSSGATLTAISVGWTGGTIGTAAATTTVKVVVTVCGGNTGNNTLSVVSGGISTFNSSGTWGASNYGVSSVTIDARGAQGFPNANLTAAGGKGGRIQATISVSAAESLQVNVGTGGNGTTAFQLAGGSNGGGSGGAGYATAEGGGGGGASDIRITPYSYDATHVLVVAAGGGGAGGSRIQNHGPGTGGGGGGGWWGGGGGGGYGGTAGGGGTSSSGGTAGALGNTGGAGAVGNQGTGGVGGTAPSNSQSATSNGLAGGAAGGASGTAGSSSAGNFVGGSGGGGSSITNTAAVTGVTNTGNFQTGSGQVIVSW